MNAPDRSGPSYNLVADAVVNATPAFPFNYSPADGFIVSNPVVTLGGTGVELVLRGIPKREVIIGVCEARKVMITQNGIFHYPGGWNSTTNWTYETFFNHNTNKTFPWFNEQETYIFTVKAPDKDNLTVALNKMSGELIGEVTVTVTDLFSGNPTFHWGYPTDAQRVNLGNDESDPHQPGETLSLLEMRAVNAGPTAVTVLPAVARTTAEVGYWVGNLWATHARTEALPCTFALVAGTGDTNNALFSIRGTNLHVAGALTSGAKSIRVQAMDRYGKTFAQALTVTVS